MPRMTTPVTIVANISATVTDIAGQSARVSIGDLTASPTNTQLTNWLNALGDCTNGAIVAANATAQQRDDITSRVANDEGHSLVNDKAVLIFQNSAGDTRREEIPAPDASLFGADGVTVDPTNAQVAAFVAATLAIYPAGYAYASGTLASRSRKTTTRRAPPLAVEPGDGDLPPALPAEVPAP